MLVVDWWSHAVWALDVETTSTDPDEARVVQLALARVEPDGSVSWSWSGIVKPDCVIPDQAAEVHGITTERAAAEGVELHVALTQARIVLEDARETLTPVAMYNARYDRRVLDGEFQRQGEQPPLPYPIVDPFVIDRSVDKYRPGKRTLQVVCERYGVTLDGAHDAEADAVASARLAHEIATACPVVRCDVRTLWSRQRTWRRVWADGYRQYLAGQGDHETQVDGEWP